MLTNLLISFKLAVYAVYVMMLQLQAVRVAVAVAVKLAVAVVVVAVEYLLVHLLDLLLRRKAMIFHRFKVTHHSMQTTSALTHSIYNTSICTHVRIKCPYWGIVLCAIAIL
jgi:hypothetical protein